MDNEIDLKADEWNRSYEKNDNFVFYPHDEVIRFVARNIRKRKDFDTFEDCPPFPMTSRGLDLGCGIGRHVRFIDDMRLQGYGIDLSPVAVDVAHAICRSERRDHLLSRIQVGSVTALPYDDGFFDFALSHGVLDSMPFTVACAGMREVRRVLVPGGLFYFDVVSGDDSIHYPEFSGEEIVSGPFETDTIQSYFNFAKLLELVNGLFDIKQCKLIRHTNVMSQGWHSRYHVIVST